MAPSFSALPAELRQYIYTLVLGVDGDTPTMVPFRTTRPFILEEEDDDMDDMFLDGEDVLEELNDEQLEHVRQAALEQEAALAGGAGGETPGAPATLPSSGVASSNGGENGTETNGNNGNAGDNHEGADDVEEEEEDEEDEEDDVDTDAGDFDPNPYAQERAWDDDALVPVHLPPLLLVNREARSVTLSWLKKHEIQLLRNKITKAEIENGFADSKDGLPVCLRKYNPEYDYLYVDRHFWNRFCDRLAMPAMRDPDDEDMDEDEEPIHDIGEGIKNLALPAFTAYQSNAAMGRSLEFMPNIESVAIVWGDLPPQEWRPKVIMQTVQRDGKPKTQVTQVLMPRYDHERINERITEEEQARRRADTERIKAERIRDRIHDDEDEDEEDEEDEEEGDGPVVTMCVRDPTDPKRMFYERGYLGTWMQEIYSELSITELPDHVVDEEDGSITLHLLPCSAVLQKEN